MSEAFQYLDILILAVVAALVLLRLRSVLGKRTGHEKNDTSRFAYEEPQKNKEEDIINIQASRLMTIHCAEVMDKEGDARVDISAIKVFVPLAGGRVVDRAIQIHGWRGVSGDTPLAGMFQGFRTLRLADGPDEVHRILIAKEILKKYHDGLSWDFGV